MTLYVLTYDLRKKPEHDYGPLTKILKSLGAAHLQNSVWLLSSAQAAGAVHETVFQHLHQDDTLCVIEIGKQWAVQNERPTGLAWLRAQDS